MANVLICTVFLIAVLVTSGVESCSIPSSIYVRVPQTIPAGYQVAKVKAADCDPNSLQLTLKDPSFTIQVNGEITTLTPVSVASGERTFSVRAQDNSGPGGEMEVHLVCQKMQETNQKGQILLRRTKRRWGVAPLNIRENSKGPFPQLIERIVSDSAANYSVFYDLSGKGATEFPFDVFSINRITGDLFVNQPVDRENIAVYKLSVSASDQRTGQQRDLPLGIEVVVDDENDNAPVFHGSLDFSVPEQIQGVKVGVVQATDKDDPNTDHARFIFKIIAGGDNFAIDSNTGVITTKTNTLDREVLDKYMVTIECRDMKGAPSGLSNTATATIRLTDINDNPPTFTKTSYTATIPENEKDKLILRIPVEDKDLIYTPNWISKFVITKGNENGNFRIDRDPKTNHGLLYVTKPLDYETTQNVKLEISARNEAELNGTTAQWQTIPVDVAVTDVDEGPEFTPPIVRFTIKENIPNGTLIGTYSALDPETKKNDGIMYYKISDPGMWVNVDKNTGELRVANTIDRESDLVQDGLYNITVRAVDSSSKSGIGTVILVIEDVNDNQPVIPPQLVLCEDKTDQLSSVLVVAEDKDLSPFSSPFSFNLLPEYQEKWSLKAINTTTATLAQVKPLPTGIYEVGMIVRDLQGFGEKQTTKVTICQCRAGVCLAKKSSVALGPMGALALFLPLALLLLLFLALAIFCSTKGDIAKFDEYGNTGGILLASNTEAPGDEVDSNLIIAPTMGLDHAVKDSKKAYVVNTGCIGNISSSTIGGYSMHDFGYQPGIITSNLHEYTSSQYDHSGQLVGNGMDYGQFSQDTSYMETYRTNQLLLDRKTFAFVTEDDGRFAEDIVHAYRYEGAGSDAGSVGCCSDQGDNTSLDFLDALGPKFKTLADVCTKS